MNVVTTPIEREFTLKEALNIGLKEISKLPYKIELQTVGTTYSAAMCHLKHENSAWIKPG